MPGTVAAATLASRIDTLRQDVRYSWRVLARSPGFAAIAILTLALGIGANTTIFSLVDGILLRPLPYRDAGRIVHLSWQGRQRTSGLSVPQLQFCQDHCRSFVSLAGFRGWEDQELASRTTKHWVKTLSVTDGFFEALGVSLEVGRPFDRTDTRPGGPYAAVLTDELWRAEYGADPSIVGRSISIGGQDYTVAGVLSPEFRFAEQADVFLSLHLEHTVADQGSNTDVIGRLKPDISLSQAQADARLIAPVFNEQAASIPGEAREGSLQVDGYQSWLGSDHRRSLLILLGAVGLLLLIACANVASLLLARANARQREISLRLALGATRRRMLAQLLTESLLLGVTGAALGLVVGVTLPRGLLAAIPWHLPAVDHIGIDGRVLLFATLIGVGTSVGFGLSSFVQIRHLRLSSTLTAGRMTVGVGRDRGRFLNVLVVGEVAIALVLAVSAGLLIDSLRILSREKLGFEPGNLVLMETPFAPGSPAAHNPSEFERQALERIEAVPGVQSAAAVSVAPLHGQNNLPAQREGRPENSIGPTEVRTISSQYFRTMGIPILRGRAIDDADLASSAPVAVISETLARAWWPGQNPIGDRLVIGEYKGQLVMPQRWSRQIVGVVADVKALRVDQPGRPTVYLPASPEGMNGSTETDFVVRSAGSDGIIPGLRQAILEVAPDQRIVDLEPMSQLVSGSIAQPNFEAWLMSGFGGLALVLTLVGVYGVSSFRVTQRTHDIGVRIALGARQRDVLGLVVGQAALLAGLGVVIGTSAALGLTRLMASLLYEVKPTDPGIFVAVAVLVVMVALLAAYLPARRAVRVDPIIAVRQG